MPGHLVATTILYAFAAYAILSYTPDCGPSMYILYLLVVLPLAAPAVALFIQYSVVVLRRIAALFAVRRVRLTFRAVLRQAARHPELADLDRLRAAAASLSRLAPADALRAAAEVAEAAQHPYAPIRTVGLSLIEAAGLARREARSG